MELKERIAALLKYSQKNISEFSRFVGFRTPQAVRELIKGNTKSLSEIAYSKIISAFPEINQDWLLTGEGEMLRSNGADIENYTASGSQAVAARNVETINQTQTGDAALIEQMKQRIATLENQLRDKETIIDLLKKISSTAQPNHAADDSDPTH
ncbi:MAG: hypothetical protein K2M87_05040 [Muribaculaceae bacterium]|nr:hypothetical protein [Muribaculaceae bacterium]